MMRSTASIVVCLVVAFAIDVSAETVPDYIHVCRKNDPQLSSCLIKSVEFLRSYLARGIPEMDIPSIEPLNLGDLLVSESSTSNGLRITAKDIKAYGPSDFVINNVHIHKYGESYTFDIGLPSLYVTGIYNVNGQILLLPIKGSGKFTGNFTNSIGKTKVTFNPFHPDTDEKVQIKKIEIKVTVGNGNVKLHNLFNGDKVLGDAINDVINQNFNVLSDDIIPLVERALQRVFKKTGNKIISRYTVKQLFPLS